MMSIERFIKDGDSNFIAIQTGVNSYELLNMSGDLKEHYIAIRFLDGSGNDVTPTGGLVELKGSLFRKPSYHSFENGRFLAADVDSNSRVIPVVYGPLRAINLTLDNIVGAVTCVAKITSF